MNLLRLAVFTGDERRRRRADAVIASTGDLLERAPAAVPRLLCALDFAESPPREVVLAGAPGRGDFEALRRAVFASPASNRVVAHAETAPGVAGLAALGEGRSAGAGAAARLRVLGLRLQRPGDRPRRPRRLPRDAVTTGLVYDERFLAHRAPYDHPEHPGRLRAIQARLEADGLAGRCVRVPAREATREELERIHTPAYVSAIAATASQPFVQLDPDTYTNHDSALAARLAAGASRRSRGRGRGRAARERFRPAAPSRPPRRGGPRHGVLPLQQRRRRGPRGPGARRRRSAS